MRKIEEMMNNAIANSSNWDMSNTRVEARRESDIRVYLHGNCIAKIDKEEDVVYLYSCGWHTPTTKSRLNAILKGLGVPSCVSQRNYSWYLENLAYKTCVEFREGIEVDF